VTTPEFDPDLNPEYRAQAQERADSEERIRDIQPPGLGSWAAIGKYVAARPRQPWLTRRRTKVVAEIEANRRGDYRVPTWVLTLILVLVILGLAALFIFG
jgi:hypothetical protein